MGEVIISNRNPTDKDPGHCFLWWNREYNRFFKFIGEKENKYIWEHLKEKYD